MALTYNKATRDLSIKGVIKLQDKTEITITDSEIISYSISQQIATSGLPLGSAESASFTLEIENEGRKYSPEQFDNAEVKMQVGIMTDSEYVYSDFGVWYVDDADTPEQSVSLTLTGCDALATRFAKTYNDNKNVYPTTIGSLATAMCAAAGIRLKSPNFANAAVVIPKMPKWEKGTTLRDILSYCAICAAGFARINRSGELEIVAYSDGATYELDPNLYQTYTPTGGAAFNFNAIEAILKKNSDDYTRFAIDANIWDNATNTIQVEYNPLLTSTIVNSIVGELKDLNISSGEIAWGGDPSVMCGDFYEITNLSGGTSKIMVTAQDFTFDGGLSVSEKCSLPSTNTNNGESYKTSSNMYDANGNIKATRISGLDESVVVATTAHFENLTAEDITADTLTAALLKAIKIRAESIDTALVETDVLTAIVADIVKATIGKIDSDVITTDDLFAAVAEMVAAKIESLKASDIATDRLAAAVAAFTVVTAGTASFDQATIKHLVAQAMNLEYGVGGDVFIRNLRVLYGQMLQATIGDLCIKASDGNYYNIDVDENGNVTATKNTAITDGEINAGQTEEGRVILETHITAESLNTGNLLATYALVNKIDTARIDVGELFANTAFIGALTTNTIVGDKSITIMAQDIAANEAAIAAQNASLASAVTELNKSIDDLQSQVDGGITTWYLEGEPTAYNEPAVSWTTEDLKEEHQGDLYYDKITGYSYRWMFEGTAWLWKRVADTDVSEALKLASSAKDAADAKKRIFYTQPTPPYDAGDLWVQGSGGDIYVCKYPKLAGFAYAVSDWALASKYTDDAKANAAQNTANEAKAAAGNAQATADAAQSTADAAQAEADTAGEKAQQAVDKIGDIPQRMEVKVDGTYFKDEKNTSVLRVNSGSVTIGTLTGDGKGYSQFAANYVQFGNYQLRRTADGGLAFKLKE